MRFLIPMNIILGSLLPGRPGFSQIAPRLALSDGSVVATGLDKKLSAALAEKNCNDEDLSKAFRIYTLSAYKKGIRQPIAGHYILEGTSLLFTPLFPFAEGESYYAELEYAVLVQKSGAPFSVHGVVKNKEQIDLLFAVPESNAPLTRIEAVYPVMDTLPENLLRMYIYFSAPMSTGEAYQHIRLMDESGNEVEKPFLIIDQELWDTDRKRLTLLFDPGRIKQGIKSNLDLGLPLNKNKCYYLVIDSLWRDERGNALSASFVKRIFVTDPERATLTAENWKIAEPQAGTKNPLVVQFDKPLDHALLLKYISVTHPLTGTVDGEAVLTQGDQVWKFTPDKPWGFDDYALEISPYLEDVAGNNFNNPFDIDLSVSGRVNSSEPVRVEFTVKEVMK